MLVVRWGLGIVFVLSLAACGGGGGGDSQLTVTATAGSGGAISPANRTVERGATTTFTVTAESGWEIASVSGCGGSLSGDTYTTGPITAACPVRATFNQLRPMVPSLTLTPRAIKTFGFTWNDVSFETEYRLLENPDGLSGYTEVAVIAADAVSFDLEDVFLPERINASYILQACNEAGCSDSAAVFVMTSLAEAVGYLKAPLARDSRFGSSLALSGDGRVLAVGSIAISGGTPVYVFDRRSDGAWRLAQTIDDPCFCEFGKAIALSSDGRVMAIGAPVAGTFDQPVAGGVFVYTREGNGSWGLDGSDALFADRPRLNSGFGEAVALSNDGSTLAVGAPNLFSSSGGAYVFSRSETAWILEADLGDLASPSDGSRFGTSVALSTSGDRLAVGAPRDPVGGFFESGSVQLFNLDPLLGWQLGPSASIARRGGLRFGTSVALSPNGAVLAIGAPGDASSAKGIGGDEQDGSAPNAGAVYLFMSNGLGMLDQAAYIKASNSGAGHAFGSHVALAADGRVLTVGAPLESGASQGVGGDESSSASFASGAVYLFSDSGFGAWSQRAYVKQSNTRVDSFFGSTVALSEDAQLLVVGAPGESGNATGIGGDQNDASLPMAGAVFLY